MGKTTPTFREAMHAELEKFDDQYRRALRRNRQHAYDDLRESVEDLTMAAGASNATDVWTPIWMSMMVVQQERIRELEERVEALEEESVVD